MEKRFYTTRVWPLSTLTLLCHFLPSGELSKTGLSPITGFPGERGAAWGSFVHHLLDVTHNDHKKDERFIYQRADQSKRKKSWVTVTKRAPLLIDFMFFAALLGKVLMQSGITESQANKTLLPRQTITAVLKKLFLSPYHTDKLWKYFRKKTLGNISKCTTSNKNCYFNTSVVIIVPYTRLCCFISFTWNLFSTPRANWWNSNIEFKTSGRSKEDSPEFSWPSDSERRARHFAGMCWCSSDGFWHPSKTPQLKEAFLVLVPCLTMPDLLPLSYPDITNLLMKNHPVSLRMMR